MVNEETYAKTDGKNPEGKSRRAKNICGDRAGARKKEKGKFLK